MVLLGPIKTTKTSYVEPCTNLRFFEDFQGSFKGILKASERPSKVFSKASKRRIRTLQRPLKGLQQSFARPLKCCEKAFERPLRASGLLKASERPLRACKSKRPSKQGST